MSRRAGGPPGGARPLEPIHAATSGPDAELFVVEGESAALAVARVRDPRTQAVLAMQGKPLNALKASPRRVASQPLFRALAAALGTGMGDDFRGDRLRFDRLLILTDPDADGIGEVVAAGELLLAFSEPELQALADRSRGRGDVSVRRYRGLAALDADLLRETCVDPATRRTSPVSSADVMAMVDVVDALGGDR